MNKKMATSITITAIASGLLAFSSVSSAATASPTFDFTDNGYAVIDGKGVETVNGLTFDARPNDAQATLTFNTNSGSDPDLNKTPCTTLNYACDGDGIGIKLYGDADEVSGNSADVKREVLKISGFGGIAINEISFLDLFYEQETSNSNFFYEKAFFRFYGGQGAISSDIAIASDPTGDNGFAYWTGLVRGVEEIRFFVNCNRVGSTKCSDNDFSVAAINAVPVPAAVWLFGSGLIGLVGIARRRKAA